MFNGFRYSVLAAVLCLVAVVAANGSAGDAKEASGDEAGYLQATFAGGCFWCMQPPFDKLDGVVETFVGYSGPDKRHPTYKDVWSGKPGLAEAVRIVYDPKKVSNEELLDVFWRNIDPTQEDGQFADRGKHYRTVIFYHDESQREKAVRSKESLEKSGKFPKPIVTSIEPFLYFYEAEDYHQDYYMKNPSHYEAYSEGSGRKAFLRRTWGTN